MLQLRDVVFNEVLVEGPLLNHLPDTPVKVLNRDGVSLVCEARRLSDPPLQASLWLSRTVLELQLLLTVLLSQHPLHL